MVPYWISSILDEEILQMSFDIPSVIISNDDLLSTSTNRVVSGEWAPNNRVANAEFIQYNANDGYTSVVTSDEYTANNVVTRDEYTAVVTNDEYKENNVLTRDEYTAVVTSDEYTSNNVVTRDEYTAVVNSDEYTSNNVVTRDEYTAVVNSDEYTSNNVVTRDEYTSNDVVTRDEYTANNLVARDEYTSNNVVTRVEYTANNVVIRDEYRANTVVARNEYTANNLVARDEYTSNNVVTRVEYTANNVVIRDEYRANNVVARNEYTAVVTSDEYTANNVVTRDEYTANNVVTRDEYTAINVITSDEFIPSNVEASSVYISNNALTREEYNTSNNVLSCDEYIPNNVLVCDEYIPNNVLASVEYISNNDLAIDGFLSSNVEASGELLPKKETFVDEIQFSGISSDEMIPNHGTVGELGGPGALVAGEALPNIASDAEEPDSDEDLMREYDVDQCERVAGDNNNQAARACGGCEPREHLEPCAGCPTCGPQDPEDDCNGCPRNLDACTNCGREPCAGCGPRNECTGCGNEPCEGCGPRGPDSAPEHCAGCGRRIRDRFFLQAVERRWHAPCLRCCECHLQLDSELTCFARDGNIFCKKDYYRLFGPKRCSRCQASISSSELVMRARDLVFHVHCFCCALCNTPLTKGDTFGMRDSTIYCRLHYEAMTECVRVPRAPPDMLGAPFFNGAAAGAPTPTPAPAPGAPRQKGRPRKRKPKDLEAMTANLDLNTEYLDMGFSRSGSGLGGSSRTKRMRTSFKHHQLRTMKSYFAINHNPDAKDLKQLSQKTGLPKRVLQVWFQNARAKWRRMMTKQEGKACSDKMSPEGGLELEGLYGAGGGGGLRLPPLSPPLDCP